jgi:hypothetical protein
VKAILILVLAVSACGNDLPPLVLTTPHVRYHARSPDEVPVGASAWIEDFRSDLLTYFGVLESQRDTVIDYYLFRDKDDLVSSSPCPGLACTSGDSPAAVYTTNLLDDYELVHGFLSPIGGAAPYMVAEGAAKNVSCYPAELFSYDTVSSWQDLVSEDDSNTQIGYGQRVVRYLLDQYGPARFIKYYADAHFTKDPGLFALDFERSYGVTFNSVWDAASALNRSDVEPTCPCTLAPLPLDTTVAADFPGHAFYRPLDIPAGKSLLLTMAPGSLPELRDCANRTLHAYLTSRNPPFDGANLAVVNLSGDNYLTFDQDLKDLTATAGDWVGGSCAEVSPTSVPAGVKGLTVITSYLGAGVPYYLNLSIEGTRQIALPQAIDPSILTVELCADCGTSGCSLIGTTPTAASGNVVLVFRPGPAPTGTMYTGAALSFG